MAESISSLYNLIAVIPNNVYINNFNNNKLHSKICRTCLAVIKENLSAIRIDSTEFNKDQIFFHKKLYLCCPELVLPINSKVQICIKCFKTVNITNVLIRKFYTNNILQNTDSFESHSFAVKTEIKAEELDLSDTDNTTNIKSLYSTIADKNHGMVQNYNFKNNTVKSGYNYNSTEGKDFTLFELEEESCNPFESNKDWLKTKLNKHVPIQTVSQSNFKESAIPNVIIHTESKLFHDCSNKDIKLKQHIYASTGKTPLNCCKCNFSSHTKFSLRKYVSVNAREKPFKCSYCDYSGNQKINLTIHLRSHTGEKPYKCTQCNFCSATRGPLVCHLRTHTGERPFKCSYCDYSAARKVNLTEHIRTHTGEKPYKCSLCNFCSATRGALVCHLRTHTGERPFKCSECDYNSATRGCLKGHLRIHTGQKPFKCSYCDYSSTRKINLTEHIRTHTGDKPYKCSQCNYNSTRKESGWSFTYSYRRETI